MSTPTALTLLAVACAFIGVASALAGALVTLPPRGWRALPWPLQARLAHPARIAPVVNAFAIPMLLAPVIGLYIGATGVAPTARWWGVATVFLGIAAAAAVAAMMAWLVSPRPSPIGRWLLGCLSALMFRWFNTSVYAVVALPLAFGGLSMPNVIGVVLLGAV